HLVGRTLTGVRATSARLRRASDVAAIERATVGRAVMDVRRRGKYIVVEFSGGTALLLHLGMTGAMRVCKSEAPRLKHEHVVWTLDNGAEWRFTDPRRFGSVVVCVLPAVGADPCELRDLGCEPLSPQFSARSLYAATRERRKPIKNLLMDQAVVAGVGNIYANEALFGAGVRPERAAAGLTEAECRRLVRAVKQVLRRAIRAGGTTISDFQAPDGSAGRFHVELAVYGRAGLPCRRRGCRGKVRRTVQAGRSTYHCPKCQR
ncbi:MAG: DNA-formamidopyrimidine glycosylase, partial [Lentisphaerae bacterium RIFOXYB12_FULL_65_16]